MAATTTGQTRIPESLRRERTVATCEICGRKMSLAELKMANATQLFDGRTPGWTWDCIGHRGKTKTADWSWAVRPGPAIPTSTPTVEQRPAVERPPATYELSSARNINQTIAKVAPALSINQLVAKVAPDLGKARVENRGTIDRLTRIAGCAGGDEVKALRSRLGISVKATDADTMRKAAQSISDDFAILAASQNIDAIELSFAINSARQTFDVVEQAFGIVAKGAK